LSANHILTIYLALFAGDLKFRKETLG